MAETVLEGGDRPDIPKYRSTSLEGVDAPGVPAWLTHPARFTPQTSLVNDDPAARSRVV